MEEHCLNLVMVGTTGSGISSTGNTILGRQVFRASVNFDSVTENVTGACGEFERQELLVVDCPGLYNTNNTDNEDFKATVKNRERALQLCNSLINSFLFTLTWGQIHVGDYNVLVNRLKDVFGDEFFNHVIIVITRGDQFSAESDVTFHEWCMQQRGPLENLFRTCEYRVVLLNNRARDIQENKDQIKSLLEFAKSLPPYTGNSTPTTISLQEGKPKKKEFRFLMVGTKGAGKSATANSLVQRYFFDTSFDTKSKTKHVESFYGKFKNNEILVVDTPGFNDTDITNDGMGVVQVNEVLKIAMTMCCGGVDAFLMVMKVCDRYTSEQKSVISTLSKIFGAEFMRNLIVILSFADTRPDISNNTDFHKWCKAHTGDFHTLYEYCDGRFITINNKEKDQKKKERKLDEILQLADKLQSSHGRYTNENFTIAE